MAEKVTRGQARESTPGADLPGARDVEPDSWDLDTEPLGGVPLDPAARAAVEETERELAEIFAGVELHPEERPPPLPVRVPAGVVIREATDAEQRQALEDVVARDGALIRARALRLRMFADADSHALKLLSRRSSWREWTGAMWWAPDTQRARRHRFKLACATVCGLYSTCCLAVIVAWAALR